MKARLKEKMAIGVTGDFILPVGHRFDVLGIKVEYEENGMLESVRIFYGGEHSTQGAWAGDKSIHDFLKMATIEGVATNEV